MTKISMTQGDVDKMLEEHAARFNYTLEEVRRMAEAGELMEPELRDLWIIWGDTPLQLSRA
jgi:hypothetical protein